MEPVAGLARIGPKPQPEPAWCPHRPAEQHSRAGMFDAAQAGQIAAETEPEAPLTAGEHATRHDAVCCTPGPYRPLHNAQKPLGTRSGS